MSLDEAGAGDDDTSADSDPSHLQIGVRVQTLPHSNGDVDSLFDQIDAPVGRQDLQAQPRMVGQEGRETTGDLVVQVQRATQAHKPLWFRPHPQGRLGRGLRRQRHRRSLRIDLPANLCDLQPAGGALQEADAQIGLELGDPPA